MLALVIDADVNSAKLASILLAQDGWQVRTASSAEEALEILVELRAELILTELVLPMMSGALFIQTLRALPGTATVPIVVLTAFNGPAVERAVYGAGATCHLTKPINVETFASQIRAATGVPNECNDPARR